MRFFCIVSIFVSVVLILHAGDVEFREDSNGYPTWDVPHHMPGDVFTFCRVQFNSNSGNWEKWRTDFPDADKNFSFRLQQLTSMQVNPDPESVTLRDREKLKKYPFLYMVETGSMSLTDPEIDNLRFYLLNGGFLMLDDSWGDAQWQNIRWTFERIFPDRRYKELDIEHPIFHQVFDLKEIPQVPSIGIAMAEKRTGITYEKQFGITAKTPYYRAYFDDEGRMCCLICHNTDLGDGWEREGVDPWYFKEFAERLSFPMGINIVTYAMSH